jgi:transposase
LEIYYLCGMRFIKLPPSVQQELEKIYHTHAKSYVRQRAQCLLLSNRNYRVPVLAGIFSTRTHTIREWFDRWENDGIQGLEIRPGRGVKPAITEENTELVDCIKQEVFAHPQSIRNVVVKVNTQFGTNLSVRQIKTFLKKN